MSEGLLIFLVILGIFIFIFVTLPNKPKEKDEDYQNKDINKGDTIPIYDAENRIEATSIVGILAKHDILCFVEESNSSSCPLDEPLEKIFLHTSINSWPIQDPTNPPTVATPKIINTAREADTKPPSAANAAWGNSNESKLVRPKDWT